MSVTVAPIKVQLVNESTVLTDAQVTACMLALQAQCDEDFSLHWGMVAVLSQDPKGTPPDPGMWQLIFADNSDQADALGYHETTVHGDPIGYAFVKTAMDDGESWTVTASHELLEMLADPEINASLEVDNSDGSTDFYFKEVCDPCEDDSFAYEKMDSSGEPIKLPGGNPVLVSDFVLPGYWNPNSTGKSFDFRGHITKQLQVISGGYASIMNVPSSVQWNQVTDEGKPGGKAVRMLNRRARHLIPHDKRRRSER